MCGQPCVPTAPCTASGLVNMAGLWLTIAWRMQPWNAGKPAGRPGTVMPPGAQGEKQQGSETKGEVKAVNALIRCNFIYEIIISKPFWIISI